MNPLVEYYHRNFYPDMDIMDVARAIYQDNQTFDIAVKYIQEKYYPNIPVGEIKPIYVNDKNDPRLKAYNDSLQAYKNFIEDVNTHKDSGYSFIGMNKMSKDKLEYKHPEYGTYLIDRVQKPVQPVVYKKPVDKPVPSGTVMNNRQIKDLESKGIGLDGKSGYRLVKSDGVNSVYEMVEVSRPTYKPKPKSKPLEKPNAYPKTPDTSNAISLTSLAPEQPPQQPHKYTSKKQMYQGREFMETTGLRPGLYHPEEVKMAIEVRKRMDKRAF